MSVEFRLKYIRDAIDKNVKDVLLKWNATKVLLNETFDEERKELCAECVKAGKENYLKYCYVNLDEAIYKCESPACLYPFRNFKYKNFVDRTIFRYERTADASENKSDQKIFTSPTKVEADPLDEFNINWFGDTNADDLDSIISAPSDEQTCDMKDIINSLCNDMESRASAAFSSPARNGSNTDQSPPSTAPKLSRCLQYIEHISPTKQTNFNCFKSKPPPARRTFQPVAHIAPPVKPEHVSSKKARHTKNRPIRPVQSIVEQQPLGFLEWLDVVSKTEPKQIQELEFAAVKNSSDLNTNTTNHSTSNPVTQSEPNNLQPILIELITPESLGTDQLPSNTKPCLLYKLDHNKLELTSGHLEAMSNNHQPVVPQTFEDPSSDDHDVIDLSEDHIDVKPPPATNVERSRLASERSQSTETTIVDIESGQDHTVTDSKPTKLAMSRLQVDKSKLKIEKEKLKVERKEKLKLERKKKKKLKLQEKRKLSVKPIVQPNKKKLDQITRNQKHFNIEIEENFLGFEPVEPFTPVVLQKKDLVWLRLE